MSENQAGLVSAPHGRVQRGWQRLGRWLALAGRGATTTPFFAPPGPLEPPDASHG